MATTPRKRIHRSGITFDCDVCGKLLRDCAQHNPPDKGACPSCRGDLKRVGIGNHLVGHAVWFRCNGCGQLFMQRRGKTVPTPEKPVFKQFA